MASTPFQVISWAPNDPIDDEKLDAMVSNDGWLRDNMMMGRYKASGVTRDIGVKVNSGLVSVNKGKGERTLSVQFEGFFSQGCNPIVTTGVVAASQRQIFVTTSGPGNSLLPTRDGFEVHILAKTNDNKKRKVVKPIYIAWHALGW